MALELLITDATNMQPGEIKKIISVLQVLAGESPVSQTVRVGDISVTTQAANASGLSKICKQIGEEINATGGKPQNMVDETEFLAPIKSAAEAFAPSTAVADPLPTAPVDTTATISIPNASAPQPPAPPAPHPVAPTADAGTPNPADLDSDGLAWDRRIHSEGKTKIANGTWRLKKGVSDDTIRMVKAEQGITAPQPPAAPMPPAPPIVALPDLAVEVAAASAGSYAEVAAPNPPAPPVIPTSDTPRSWLQTVQRTVDGVKAGKYTAEDLGGLLLSEFGVPSVTALTGPDNVDNLAALNAVLDQWEAK